MSSLNGYSVFSRNSFLGHFGLLVISLLQCHQMRFCILLASALYDFFFVSCIIRVLLLPFFFWFCRLFAGRFILSAIAGYVALIASFRQRGWHCLLDFSIAVVAQHPHQLYLPFGWVSVGWMAENLLKIEQRSCFVLSLILGAWVVMVMWSLYHFPCLFPNSPVESPI